MSQNIPWDSVVVGMDLGELEHEITEKEINAYVRDWDDPNPWYTEASPWGAPVLPPAFNAGLSCFALLASQFNARATVGVKSNHENLKPVTVPQKITTKGRLADKYVKRGYEYVIVESTSYDAQGTAFRRGNDHILLSFEKVDDSGAETSQTPNGEADEDGARLDPAAPEIGTELTSTQKVVYQRALDTNTFAEDSSHNDDNARAYGYPGALVSAYVLCGLMSEPLVNFFGEAWFTSGHLSVSFVGKGCQQGDKVSCGGVVRQVELLPAGSRRLGLEIWMDKDSGVRPVIGRASGVLAADSH